MSEARILKASTMIRLTSLMIGASASTTVPSAPARGIHLDVLLGQLLDGLRQLGVRGHRRRPRARPP